MPDKLTEMFNAWKSKTDPLMTPNGYLFQAFQGGWTAGAVSMRERAMDRVSDVKDYLSDEGINALRNSIGSLSDIG